MGQCFSRPATGEERPLLEERGENVKQTERKNGHKPELTQARHVNPEIEERSTQTDINIVNETQFIELRDKCNTLMTQLENQSMRTADVEANALRTCAELEEKVKKQGRLNSLLKKENENLTRRNRSAINRANSLHASVINSTVVNSTVMEK